MKTNTTPKIMLVMLFGLLILMLTATTRLFVGQFDSGFLDFFKGVTEMTGITWDLESESVTAGFIVYEIIQIGLLSITMGLITLFCYLKLYRTKYGLAYPVLILAASLFYLLLNVGIAYYPLAVIGYVVGFGAFVVSGIMLIRRISVHGQIEGGLYGEEK